MVELPNLALQGGSSVSINFRYQRHRFPYVRQGLPCCNPALRCGHLNSSNGTDYHGGLGADLIRLNSLHQQTLLGGEGNTIFYGNGRILHKTENCVFCKVIRAMTPFLCRVLKTLLLTQHLVVVKAQTLNVGSKLPQFHNHRWNEQ